MNARVLIFTLLAISLFLIGCDSTFNYIDASGELFLFTKTNTELQRLDSVTHSTSGNLYSKPGYTNSHFGSLSMYSSPKLGQFWDWLMGKKDIVLAKQIMLGQANYKIGASITSYGATISVRDESGKFLPVITVSNSSPDLLKEFAMSQNWTSKTQSTSGSKLVSFLEPGTNQRFHIQASWNISGTINRTYDTNGLKTAHGSASASATLSVGNAEYLSAKKKLIDDRGKEVTFYAKIYDRDLDGFFTESDGVELMAGRIFLSGERVPLGQPVRLSPDDPRQYVIHLGPQVSIPPLALEGLVAISTAAGPSRSLALAADGSVMSWGNDDGEPYDGSTGLSHDPVAVERLKDIAAVAAGKAHSAALKRDGTVWTWGLNTWGQLGNGSHKVSGRPAVVAGLSDIKEIALGHDFSVALKRDGTVWTWGNNYWGQLGDGTTAARDIPAKIINLNEVTAIAAGDDQVVALRKDGTIWAWGNAISFLPDNAITAKQTVPVQLASPTGVAALATGWHHILALRNDGTVWAWGDNSNGQLGDGAIEASRTPMQIPGLDGAIAIAASGYYSAALRRDGTVWVWGTNREGQLGMETEKEFRSTPAPVKNLPEVAAISCGPYHMLAVTKSGAVFGWGGGLFGKISKPYRLSIQAVGP